MSDEQDAGGASSDVQEQARETSEHVEQAAEQVQEATTSAPTQAIEDVLKSVSEVLAGVQTELKRSNDLHAKSLKRDTASTTQAVASAPAVAVETPEKTYRTIRRNGRKVKREA